MMFKYCTKGGLFLSLFFLGFLILQTGQISFAMETHEIQTITLKLDGITCGGCIGTIKTALLKVHGVKAVEVKVNSKWLFFKDYSNARAVVEFEPSKTSADEYIKAVEGAGNARNPYKATLTEF